MTYAEKYKNRNNHVDPGNAQCLINLIKTLDKNTLQKNIQLANQNIADIDNRIKDLMNDRQTLVELINSLQEALGMEE